MFGLVKLYTDPIAKHKSTWKAVSWA